MTELIRAYPAAAPVLGDLLAKNLDWPEADEIAKRLQALLPAAANGDGPASAMVAKLQQQIAVLMAQLQGLQNDRALDAERLRIDAFKAETDRLKLTGEMAQKNGWPPDGGFSFGLGGQGANAQRVPAMGTMTARRTVMAADSTDAPGDDSTIPQDLVSTVSDGWEPSADNRFATTRPTLVGDLPANTVPVEIPNPGAVFDDVDAAAKDIHGVVNPASKALNMEYGWQYYFDNKTGKIGHTDPVPIGKAGGANIELPFVHNGRTFDPSSVTLLGYGHTHGDYSVRRGPNGPIERATRREDPTSDNFSTGARMTGIRTCTICNISPKISKIWCIRWGRHREKLGSGPDTEGWRN